MSSAYEGQGALAVVAVFYVCTRVLKIGTGHIFALLITAALLLKMRKTESTSKENLYERIDNKIVAIGSPSWFYVDSNAVDFFYDYLGWRALNPDNYDRCVEAIDNMLRILLDTEKPLIRCVDHYHIAADYGSTALNLMHGFVYVISEPLIITKLERGLVRLEGLIAKYLRQMKHNCAAIERGKGRRDVNWSYIPEAVVPKPYDSTDTQFNFYGRLG